MPRTMLRISAEIVSLYKKYVALYRPDRISSCILHCAVAACFHNRRLLIYEPIDALLKWRVPVWFNNKSRPKEYRPISDQSGILFAEIE